MFVNYEHVQTSTNITFFLGGKINRKLSFTLDYYSINVEDRIVLSTEITPPNLPAFAGLSDLSFFVNAQTQIRQSCKCWQVWWCNFCT
jgi:hypothetical protein